MKRISAFALALGIAAMAVLLAGAQDFIKDMGSKYPLTVPRISTMPAQRMLVVEFKGDPNVAGKEAFSLLLKTFFSLPFRRMWPPRVRWMGGLETPKSEWIGLYALPLPESVTALPSGVTGVRIETWEYGEVAEILHIGPYSEETPTVEKLLKFVQDKGYEIAGPHEEEYLKGPRMAQNPADYWTVIRYQVKKRQ